MQRTRPGPACLRPAAAPDNGADPATAPVPNEIRGLRRLAGASIRVGTGTRRGSRGASAQAVPGAVVSGERHRPRPLALQRTAGVGARTPARRGGVTAQMANERYTGQDHDGILESIRAVHRLAVLETYKVRDTLCCVAESQAHTKIFVKVKSFRKNRLNESRFRRALRSNRSARRVRDGVMPRLIEFRAFERDSHFWITNLSAYGGEPVSERMFFEGDDAVVDDRMIDRLRDVVDAIQSTPADSLFQPPDTISQWLSETFGPGTYSAAAAEWTSAHCDFHWGNILAEGAGVVDWDMFGLAPKGFDAASIVLFSASDKRLFERLYPAFRTVLATDSGRVATVFAAARILRLIRGKAFGHLRHYEPHVRDAVKTMLGAHAA